MNFEDFNDYQYNIRKFCVYPGKDDSGIVPYPYFGLVGETGEVFEKVKKILRDKGGTVTYADTEDITKELGDCLFYLARIAQHLGINLGDVASTNLIKLQSRLDRNKIQGQGDNR